jgi:hypothetical protein
VAGCATACSALVRVSKCSAVTEQGQQQWVLHVPSLLHQAHLHCALADSNTITMMQDEPDESLFPRWSLRLPSGYYNCPCCFCFCFCFCFCVDNICCAAPITAAACGDVSLQERLSTTGELWGLPVCGFVV